MYEGWVCFGGTEIINNMRAIGYAGTASQIQNRWAPPIPGNEETLLATNLAENPSFEMGGSGGTVQVRENLNTNPTLRGSTASWTSTRTMTATPDGAQIDYIEAAGTTLLYNSGPMAAATGQEWHTSMVVTVPEGYPPFRMYVVSFSYGTNTILGQSPSVTVQPGETVTLDALPARTVPEGTTGVRSILYGVDAAVGNRVIVSDALLEVGSIGPYFDGDASPDPDLTALWTGTADASTSILTGRTVARTNAGPGTSVIQSTMWAADRDSSMRIIASGATNETYAVVADVAGSGYQTQLTPGTSYTVLATRHLEGPLTGELSSYAGTIVLDQPGFTVLTSPALPDVAGDASIRWSFTVDPGATDATLRLGHGASSGDVWWDALLIAEGDYLRDYFDGSSEAEEGFFYHWDEAPDDAPSQWWLAGGEQQWSNYCDIHWFDRNHDCPDLWDALNEPYLPDTDQSALFPYEAQYIQEDAPWASDSVYEASQKFMGVYALSIESLSDSTRSAPIVEGILDGGIIGRTRNAVPTFRFRVLLTALDMEGLEYGTAWLSRALAEQDCSSHGPSCGSTDISFLASCPPPASAFTSHDGSSNPSRTYDLLIRSYHDVKCVEGPIVTDEFHREPNKWGRIVEFTVAAGVPYLYGATGLQEGSINASSSTIITDVPRNAIPTPSAELPTGGLIVATNYSLNPSVETNATGWSATTDGTAITSAMVTSGRITGELSAVGTASFRSVFTATGASTSAGWFANQQEVNFSARPPGARISVNMWSAEILAAGTPVRGDIAFTAIWRDGTTELGTEAIGVVPVNGGAATTTSLLPPDGATSVLVRAQANLTSWPAGTIVRLYSDALAVTVP